MKSLNKIHIIATYTFKEIFKSKILMNTIFLGVFLLLVTYVAYSFTYGEPGRIALDFGLGTLSLSSVGMAIFIGVGILYKEIESRTVYMIISRPVPRYAFILGKLLGLISMLVLNVFLLSILTLSLYFFIGGEFQPLILWSILFIIFEAVLVLLVVSLFSLVTSQTISVILTLLLYVIGHSIDSVGSTSMIANNEILHFVIEAYHFILPGFYKLNLKNFVLYNQSLPLSYLGSCSLYFVIYSLFLSLVCITVFNKKNLD